MEHKDDILIAGAGIGGLTLALQLHHAGISCQVHEAAPDLIPIGAGVNLLPHSTGVLAELGLLDRLRAASIETRESAFYNRHGQLVYAEPAGRHAGHDTPQLSIHRGALQSVLLEAVRERLGVGAVQLGSTVTAATSYEDRVEVTIVRTTDRSVTRTIPVAGVVGADGIHSALRKQLHPDDGAPLYSGVTMWRGVVRAPSFLTGGSMVRAGWLASGKLVIYPLTEPDADGTQLINWVAEVERARPADREWSRAGKLEDFIDVFADWKFEWLDVPALMASTETILEYPMVDQDPLPQWGGGRITLLGDAAHPMVPRGSNGAGQAILDTRALRAALEAQPTIERAFSAYEAERVPATATVVLTNRTNPPDAILREVYERTGDEPFENIDEVISQTEIATLVQTYREVTGMRPSA